MALCVIAFDGYFLNNPTLCWFTTRCDTYASYDQFSDLTDPADLYNIKVPLIKGQLAAGVLMLVTCLIYIIIYIITSYQISKQIRSQIDLPTPVTVFPASNQYHANVSHVNHPVVDPLVFSPYNASVGTRTNTSVTQKPMICPNCKSNFQLALQNH
jgi:hypothetical protein